VGHTLRVLLALLLLEILSSSCFAVFQDALLFWFQFLKNKQTMVFAHFVVSFRELYGG